MKKFFYFLGALLIAIIAAAIIIPYFFKDEIIAKVKEEINKNVNAEVDFKDVSLGLFKSFPDFCLELEGLSVTGKDAFEGIPLVKTNSLALSLDLMSVIKSDQPIAINSIALNQPLVNVLVLKNGKANYDITLPSEAVVEESSSGESSDFLIQLEKYSITDGTIVYDDRAGNTYLKIEDLNHAGSGNLTADVYDLVTKTNIGSLTAKSGGINYLNKVKADADITVNADMNKMKFTLKDNNLSINALKVSTEGYVAMPNDDINMDLKFAAPNASFKEVLSLIPSAYTADFADVKANGTASLDGFVKGTFNENSMPAFGTDVQVQNADFQYPDLPLGVDNINANIKVNSPSSNLDKMTVDIPKFSMKVGSNPLEGRFKLSNPMTDPTVDTKVNGVIDLAEMAKAFPLEDVEEMNGKITADVLANTRMSYIDKQEYDKVQMDGKVQVENVKYNAKDMPTVLVNNMVMDFSPSHVNVDNFSAKLGKSDIQAQGKLDNILAYFSPTKTLKGNLKISSNLFDANEWMAESSTPVSQTTAAPAATEEGEVFDRFDFSVDADFKKIQYEDYVLENSKMKGHATSSKARLDNFTTKIGASDIQASGQVENVFAYLFDNELLQGKMDIKSNNLDLNELMGYIPAEEAASTSTTTASTEAVPFLVPENMDLAINAVLENVKYTNLDLKNVNGLLVVKNEQVNMKDVKAQTMGGDMILNGGYDSQNHEKPKFNIDYKINKFAFQEAFNKVNTFEKLAPIGKFIDGIFNSTFNMSGELGKDMMPDLSTLNASGFLNTIKGVVKNFKPMGEVGNSVLQKLNVDFLGDDMSIVDTKNWFEIKNGFVEIKPFDFKVKDVAMNISGKHGLTSDMDYDIKMKLPRSKLGKNNVGAAANKGLDWLSNEASKLGIKNVQVGEFINVLVNLKGSIKSPKAAVKLLGSEGESVSDTVQETAKEVVKQAVDSVKTRANEELVKVKDKATKIVDKTVDSVTTVVQDKVDKAVDKVTEEVGKKVEDAVKDKVNDAVKDKVGDKIKDITGDKAGETGDKIKDAVKGWNPFKKKKKEEKKEEAGGN